MSFAISIFLVRFSPESIELSGNRRDPPSQWQRLNICESEHFRERENSGKQQPNTFTPKHTHFHQWPTVRGDLSKYISKSKRISFND